MPSKETLDTIAAVVTGVYVVSVLLWGLLIVQQLLLSVLIALGGILVYVIWRRRSERSRDGEGGPRA